MNSSKLKCEACKGLGCFLADNTTSYVKCQECLGTGVVGGKPDPKDGGLGTELEIRQFEP